MGSSRKRYVGYSSLFSTIAVILLLAIMVLAIAFWPSKSTSNNTVNSVRDREKLELGIGFDNNCIIDELDWFDNLSSASRKLQTFYEKTGIQPFIYLRAYDPTLTTDDEKEQYAVNWYDEHIDNEGTFLYVYFAEKDQDNEVGFMAYVNGKQISTVMDAEAVDVFWNYLDNEWYTDKSTDDVFASAFTRTATEIMKQHKQPTNGWDVFKVIIICACVIGVIVLLIYIIKLRRKHAAEKAEETRRILETPLGNSTADDLADKYSDKN